MATQPRRAQPKVWGQKSKIDEELDYFTELALHESERWIQAVTRRKFKFPDDPRKSLENGILLCELLNGLKAGTIRKVNTLSTPLAGMDNVNVFLDGCRTTFGLKEAQLFHPCDLEDLCNRAIADFEDQLKYETDRRLRHVAVTIYWLGRAVQPWYKGPHLDCSAFSDLIGYHHPKLRLTTNNIETSSENVVSEELHTRQESCDSLDRSSGYSSYRGESKSSSCSQHHSRQESSDSVDRNSGYRNDTTKSSQSSDVFEDDPVTSQAHDESYEPFVSEDLPLMRRSNIAEKRQTENVNITPDTGETDNMPIPQEYSRRVTKNNRLAEQRYSATFDSTYTPDGATSPNLLSHQCKSDAVYQSTPHLDAGVGDHNRFRFGDDHVEKPRNASSSSDNAKPCERRSSCVVPGSRKTSIAHVDPLQFVYVGGNKLSEKAKEVIEAMEEQKKITKALEHEETDWHSNLSNWKSKMRTKSKAAHERTEDMERPLEDEESSNRKAKTFSEMMSERERRKSTGRHFYPYTEEDVGALGGLAKLRSASTTQTPVNSVYHEETHSSRQNSESTVARRAETFESEHVSYASSETNHEQTSVRKTSTNSSHNRYTVSPNVRTQDLRSASSQSGKEGNHDRGREMMERRRKKEADESQPTKRQFQGTRGTDRDYKELLDQPSMPRWRHHDPDDVFEESVRPTRISIQERRSMFEQRTLAVEIPQLTKPAINPIKTGSSVTRFDSGSVTSAPLVEPQSVCLYRHKPILPPDLAERQEQGSSTAMNMWGAIKPADGIEDASSTDMPMSHDTEVPTLCDVASSEVLVVCDLKSLESQVAQEITSTETGQQIRESDSEEYEEKTISLSQKPNGDKGFGFTISGGKEFSSPIVIDKVTLGSAADAFELLEGDEIVAINGVVMTDYYQGSVMYVINQGVRTGVMELVIRRYPCADSDESEEEPEEREQEQLWSKESEQEQLRSKESEQLRSEQSEHRMEEHRMEEHRMEEHRMEESRIEEQRIEEQRMEEQQQQKRQQLEEQWEEEQEQRRQEQQLHEQEQRRIDEQWEEDERQQQLEQEQWERLEWEQRRLEQEQGGQQLGDTQGQGQQLGDTQQESPREEQASLEETNCQQMELPEVPSESPPPLPSVLPPAPNWNTFPAATGDEVVDDFFDQKDFLPDMGVVRAEGREMGETGCVRTDMLRRKSQFLGLQNSEEYHSLQTDKQQKEKSEWERIEASVNYNVADVRTKQSTWLPTEGATHDRDGVSHNGGSSNVFGHKSSSFDLEQREMEIIADLERGEEAGRRITSYHGNEDDLDGFSSRSTESVSDSTSAGIEARVTLDMRTTVSKTHPTRPSPTGRNTLDLDEERRRMERWDAEQEEKRKPMEEWKDYGETKQQYEAEQQRIRKTHEDGLRKSQKLDVERRKQLAETEATNQIKLDEIRRQADADEKRRRAEEEEMAREEEKSRIRQRQVEEKRKLLHMELAREDELKAAAAQARIEKERIEAAELKSEEERMVRKQKEERKKRDEEETIRRLEEDRQRREKERVRKMEEDQRVQEEREAASMKVREERLRLMEERIRREAEELRLEKERFEMEKTNRQQPWGVQRANTVPTSDTTAAQGWQRANTVTAATPGVTVDEVKRGYVPRNNAYQGQFERVYEPEAPRPDDILTTQPQFHADPNKIFTLHHQPDDNTCHDNGYYANGNGVSPRATFEKTPRNALLIPPKPSIREEMGLRPETRRAYGSQSNVAQRTHDRSPTGSEASLPDTGREAALRSSRLPSGSSFLYPARDGKDSGSRHQEPRPEPIAARPTRTTPAWADNIPSKPAPSIATNQEQASPVHLTKAELHHIAAVPKPRYNDNWIKPVEEPLRRRSEIMRQNISHSGEHWLYEEAERRRLAAQQPSQPLQKRQDPSQYHEHQWWPQQSPSGTNGCSVAYGDSGYGVPQRYDYSEQSHSPAYRTSYDHHANHQPPNAPRPSSHDQTPERVTPPRYPNSISPRNHSSYSSSTNPHSPSYRYPSSTPQFYPDNAHSLPAHADPQQPSRVSYPAADPVHSRTSSQNSEPPPVPPKPPRLLSSSVENSHSAEQVIAVSGYQACAHCGDELGQGAAMVIEPLALYYHIECFRCCVCYAPLGTGERGTDVRVRASRLHCQNCYSSDEDGLKYSRV